MIWEMKREDIPACAEILARVEGHELFYHSLDGGIVKSAQDRLCLRKPE